MNKWRLFEVTLGVLEWWKKNLIYIISSEVKYNQKKNSWNGINEFWIMNEVI